MDTSQSDTLVLPEVPTVTAGQAYQEMKTGNPAIIDVRPAEFFAKGHIRGAINIPIDTFGKRAVRELTNKDKRILVYCRAGYLVTYAVEFLQKNGYKNAVSMGGMQGWPYEIVR